MNVLGERLVDYYYLNFRNINFSFAGLYQLIKSKTAYKFVDLNGINDLFGSY